MSTSMIHADIDESDQLRKILNYVADRERLEKMERNLINFITKSFKRHESIILSYINTTNEVYEFVTLAGKEFHIGKIRQLLHKTDTQCSEIIQQFGLMNKFIDSKLSESNGIKLDVIANYENSLLDLQLSLNQCEIHKKNRKSANLVRKIRVQINNLIEKIKTTDKKIAENFTSATNQFVAGSDDEDDADIDSDDNVLDPEDY